MTCHNCQTLCKKSGKHRNGLQRYRCNQCRKTFTEEHEKPLEEMRLKMDKALLCLQLLVEGNSIRSTERITGVHRDTILDLLVLAGEKCERLLNERIKGLPVRDVQCDEMWGYVGMKQKTMKRKTAAGTLNATDTLGDAWTFVAMERHSKLVLAWHLGRRTVRHTVDFTEKLYAATEGRFQLTTDGFAGYPDAIAYSLGTRVDFAQLVKVYAASVDGNANERRYSPAIVTKAIPTPRWGNPDMERVCTSHIERQNLTMRMMIRRLTRLTNAFSKKWSNLRAALALHFAYYNFCRVHKSLRCTPAMEAGITGHIWELKDLLTA
jgi:transposase-like protein/IS1 family transposase